MANANRAAGLIPVNYLNGTRWNGQANIYYIPQSDTNAYAVGDPLATAVGSADLNGVSAVTLATAGTGQPVRGVLVGVGTGEGMMANPQNLNQIFVPATKTRPYYVMVVDDPNVIFEIQANDNHYGYADIGNNCNLLAGVNNGYTSGWQIDDSVASTGYTSAGQLRLLGTSRRLANVLGQAHCAFLVLLRTHELGSAGGGGSGGNGASFSLDSNGNPVGQEKVNPQYRKEIHAKTNYTFLSRGINAEFYCTTSRNRQHTASRYTPPSPIACRRVGSCAESPEVIQCTYPR